jgi:hypothetical protein
MAVSKPTAAAVTAVVMLGLISTPWPNALFATLLEIGAN